MNEYNGNFEIGPPPNPMKNHFIDFRPKRNLVSSLLILNKSCMQKIIGIVRAVCELFPKHGDWLTDRRTDGETDNNIHSALAGV